jgi:hypothetical protein
MGVNAGLGVGCGVAQAEVAGEGVDEAMVVDDGVVVGVVDRAGFEESAGEGRFAGVGAAGDDDGAAVPDGDTGMHEEVAAGVGGDVVVQIVFEVVGEEGEAGRAVFRLAVDGEGVGEEAWFESV